MNNILTGDKMLKECCSTNSIEKVLDYIEKDINNPEKKEDVTDFVDVHAFLTKLKMKSMEKSRSDVSLNDDLLIYMNMIGDSFRVIFGEWGANTILMDDRVIISNDIVYIDVNEDYDMMGCVVSFHKFANPIIVAEAVGTLKDIFGMGVKVSSELFVMDEATDEYIWGDEEIASHLKRVNGIKVKPIVIYGDNTIGNC